MLEVTVKTLDSQNHSFSVPDESTVKEFKSQIAPVLKIAADKQRLIFCGKVLKDDKKLSEYDVNGKVIHVVQSLPPQSNSSSASSSTFNTPSHSSPHNPRDAAGFLLGAFTIPQDLVDPTQVQNIVQDVVSGMGEIGRNATVMSRSSDDGSVDVHINLGRVPVQVPIQSEAQLRMNRVQTMLIRANHLLESLEDGANSNNGNVADSSSQTENGSEDAQHSPMEAESTSFSVGVPISSDILSASDEPQVSDTPITQTDEQSETNSESPVGSSTDGFEGLAHAAQAAISAAFAMGAAAARAATASVSGTTPTTTSTNSPPDTETMDVSSTENPLQSFPDVQILDPTILPVNVLSVDPELAPEPPQPEPSSGTNSENSDHHPDCPLNSSRTPPTSGTAPSTSRRSRPLVQPSVQTLANLLDEVVRVNTRLQPWLERCRDLVRKDPVVVGRALGDHHRLFSRVSQLMHFLSHAYHSLSDLHINFSQPPPRSPRVRIISSTHSSSLFQGLPMQAQISISTSNGSVPNTSQSTATTTTNAENSRNTTTESRPVPTPRTTQSSTGTSVPLTATGHPLSFVSRASNPLVFMEVSPTSLTIDSITSFGSSVTSASTASTPSVTSTTPTNVTTAPLTSTTTATSSRDATSTSQSPETSETPRTSARASPRYSGQSPLPMGHFRNLIPVPLTSMGSLHTFDSGLPCHSVWALEPSRRRHNAGQSRTSTTASSAGVNPNVPGRQEEQLQQVISNIMMSLLNHTPAQAGNPVPAGFTVFTSRPDDNSSERDVFSISSTAGDRILRRAGSANNGHNAGSAPLANLPNNIMPSCEVIAFVEQDRRLAQFTLVECLPEINVNLNGALGDVLTYIGFNLYLKDVVEISVGNFQSLDRLHEPLRKFILDEVFKSQSPNDEDIENVAKTVLVELELYINPFLTEAESLAGFEYTGDLHQFLQTHVREILSILISQPGSHPGGYGNRLISYARNFFRSFMTFNDTKSWNANLLFEEAVMGIVRQLPRQSTEEQHPLLPDVLQYIGACVRDLLVSLIRRPEPASMPYSIRLGRRLPERRAPEGDSSGGGQRAGRSSSSDRSRGGRPGLPLYMRSREGPNSSRTDESSSRPRGERRSCSSDRSRVHRPSPMVRRLEMNDLNGLGMNEGLAMLRNITRPSDPVPASTVFGSDIGSDSWHNSVPRHWVPFIDRDVIRQRRQAPQPPFSDAYISGMPSKRRKIMSSGHTPTLLEPSQGALSQLLQQAITSAGVRPRTSVEAVLRDVAENAPLQTAFQQHVRQAIQERLRTDPDYSTERFPNSEKYFK